MNLLLIKTSSLGDVIHALPALTDARIHHPNLRCTWVVEELFSDIPAWHPAVQTTLPIAWRRWRGTLTQQATQEALMDTYHLLRAHHYDLVIDAQGLYKSALIALCTKGERHGFDLQSAREPLASLCYQKKHAISKTQHAIARLRSLFAKAFAYPEPTTAPDYDIKIPPPTNAPAHAPLLFIHGTSRIEKEWPENAWIALGAQAQQLGIPVELPWGSKTEHERAMRIGNACPNATVLPKMSLNQIAERIGQAKAVVAVDTGIGHLAAALGKPTLSLYGPTNPSLIGTQGSCIRHLQLQAPERLSQLSAETVWTHLMEII